MVWMTTVESHDCAGDCLTMRAKFEIDDTNFDRGSLTPAAANSSADPCLVSSYSSTEDHKVTARRKVDPAMAIHRQSV